MPQKQPFLGAVVGAVLPTILAGAIEGAVRGAVQQATGSSSGTDTIAKDVVKRLEQNPAVVNQVNAEAPYQSRVVWGGSLGVIGAVGVIFLEIGTKDFPNYDYERLVPAFVTLGGSLFVLYGRLKGGLKPLFSR